MSSQIKRRVKEQRTSPYFLASSARCLSFFLGFWCLVQGLEESALQVAILAPILNILGIWQGFAARRRGTRASGGLILNGLGLCIFIGIAALIMLIVNALSGIN